MKKLLYTALAAVAIAGVTQACADDDSKTTWEEYAEWRENNNNWVKQLNDRKNPDGTPYYEVVSPSWYDGGYVLMHRFGQSNTQNLQPKSNSTVDVIYQGFNWQGERFDSSLTITAFGRPGVARFALNEVIDGWTAAFETMYVGDSAEIICPYRMAYGESAVSSLILPYSALRFNVRLVDIHAYEKP